MSTRCIDLTAIPPEKERKNPNYITFGRFLEVKASLLSFSAAFMYPNNYDCLELICKNYKGSGWDLIYAFRKGEVNQGNLYIGHWNDGVVNEEE